jgi:hypothetical protein
MCDDCKGSPYKWEKAINWGQEVREPNTVEFELARVYLDTLEWDCDGDYVKKLNYLAKWCRNQQMAMHEFSEENARLRREIKQLQETIKELEKW